MKLRMKVVAVLAAAGMLAAACGDDDSGSTTTPTGTGAATTAPTTTRAPVTGGTVTFGSYSKIQGLDPIVGLGQGTSGGIPMNALYDTITRWNPDTKQYVMRTAETVTANADSTEWTVKLKAGIKFSDGSDYNAEAVQFGINRHRVRVGIALTDCAKWWACTASPVSSAAYTALIKDVVIVDNLTLRFPLNEPYTAFPFILSAEAGMIPSMAAIKKACPDPAKAPNQCDFNLKPVGAGAFMVESYKPDDSIKMVRNPNYYGGQVYLDGVTFLDNGDTGGLGTYDKLKTNTIQAAFLRDPQAVAQAKADKFAGFSTINQNGSIVLLNMGVAATCAGGQPAPLCTGKPDGPTPTNPGTKELKVRQAIAAALDPKVINERGYGGKALAGSAMFQSSFPWDPKVPGAVYNVDNAKKLVSEAKAAGWSGNLSVLYVNTQLGRDVGQSVTTMLQTVGINAVLETPESTVQQQRVTTTKDYELATWGMALSGDDGAVFALAQNLRSDSPTNRVGFKSPVVDQALKDIRIAKSDAEKTTAFKKIAEEVNAQVPFVTLAATEEYNAVSPKLHDAVGGGRSYIFFDKAWLEK
jgi:peptide/nickel transport system substrate-binding protein